MNAPGEFDEDTIEVIGYDISGAPRTFDPSRPGYERYLLPWRVQKCYGITNAVISFVMPDEACTQYAIYFDTVESALGKPQRFRGIVGDGDWFRQSYGRREIGACVYDDFADLDGDGDLDLLKGGTEPFIYVWENVGGCKYVERGRLSNGGAEWMLPRELGNNRSWLSVEACDWDDDGDIDLFVHFAVANSGPNYSGQLVRYENTTMPGGPITFVDRGALTTTGGKALDSTITIVDWDGDGKKDILSGVDGIVTFHKNVGADRAIANMQIENGQYVLANGLPIELWSPRIDCADLDSDGDLDMLVGMNDGRIYWFENIGTRTNPVFPQGRIIVFGEGGYMDLGAGVKIADFDGDGLLDFVVDRYWERTHWGEQPRVFGRLYKNVGTAANPVFEERDAFGGAPYTEEFQICDALRQNGVRAVDWNNDGRTDLVAGDTDGFVWLFRNIGNQKFPVFAPGERLMAGGDYIKVLGEEERRVRDGYARTDICDWNNDGRKDLVVADGRGWIFLYLNEGTDAAPVLAAGTRLYAYNKSRTQLLVIDGTARSSVMVCDWDGDGRKDVIHAITGQGNVSENWNWPSRGGDQSLESGFLFYRNVGTDDAPVLDYPSWITDRWGNVITYPSRPNCGSFVDWNGDGRKDFIAAQFEASVRYYENTNTIGGEPKFEDTNGVEIVRPFTVQMISGADAVDFNQDGDIDILTGQGHGGSGLRFYERDYIEDTVNGTFPTSTISGSEWGRTIAGSKPLPDGVSVIIPRVIVTAVFDGFFYVESPSRESGIRVDQPGHGRTVGETVDIRGVISTNSSGERYILASSVTPNN